MAKPSMLCPVMDGDPQPLQCSIMVLGDFAGKGRLPDWTERLPLTLPDGNLSAAFDSFRPQLELAIDDPTNRNQRLPIELYFGSLADFDPDRIIERVPLLREIAAKRKAAGADLADELDAVLDHALTQILDDSAFQEMESLWRTLDGLCRQAADEPLIVIEALSGARKEWGDELRVRADISETTMFQILGERIYSSVGDRPVNALLIGGGFSRHPQDIAILERLIELGSYLNCSVLAGASPDLLGLSDFTELSNSPRIEATVEHTKWNSLREMNEARSLSVHFPDVWVRPPHGERQVAFDGSYVYDETRHRGQRAGNTAHGGCLAAAKVIDQFKRLAWFGGLTEKPAAIHESACCREVRCDDGQRRELPVTVGVASPKSVQAAIDLGLAPISHRDTQISMSWKSCYHPKATSTPQANQFQSMTRHVGCTLSVGRIAHYLNRLVGLAGGYDDASVQRELDKWLQRHVNEVIPGNMSDDKPLASASVKIERDRSGNTDAIAELVFWLDEGKLPAPIKLGVPL